MIIHRLREMAGRSPLIQPRTIAIQKEQVTLETTEQRYYLVRKDDKLAALTRLFEMEEICDQSMFWIFSDSIITCGNSFGFLRILTLKSTYFFKIFFCISTL